MIGYLLHQYDQRVTFKLEVLVSLVLVQKQNYLSVEIQLLMGFQSQKRLKMYSIPNEKFDFFIQKFKLYYPESLQFINTRQLHVFFNKPKLDNQLFVDFCCFTCFEPKIVFVMIFRTIFGSQQVKHRNQQTIVCQILA